MRYLIWLRKDPKTCKQILAIIGPVALQALIIAVPTFIDILIISTYIKNTSALNGAAIAGSLVSFAAVIITSVQQAGNIFIGRLYGRRMREEVKAVSFYRILISFLAYGFFIALIFIIGDQRLLQLILGFKYSTTVNNNIIQAGNTYFSYMVLANIPLVISLFIYTSSRVYGKVWFAVIITIIKESINIIFSILLVGGFTAVINLGVKGVALGTVISSCVEFLILCCYIYKTQPVWWPSWHSWRIHPELLKKFLLAVFFVWFNAVLYPIYLAVQQTVVAHIGNKNLLTAVNLTFQEVFLYFAVIGAFFAPPPTFVSKYLGAGDIKKSQENAEKVLLVGTFIILSLGLIFLSSHFWWGQLYGASKRNNKELQIYIQWFVLGMAMGSVLWALGMQLFIMLRIRGYIITTSIFNETINWFTFVPVLYCLLNFSGLPYQYSLFITPWSYIIALTIYVCLYKFLPWYRPLVKTKASNKSIVKMLHI